MKFVIGLVQIAFLVDVKRRSSLQEVQQLFPDYFFESSSDLRELPNGVDLQPTEHQPSL